jgi:membrane-associated phospholipid phosphatase
MLDPDQLVAWRVHDEEGAVKLRRTLFDIVRPDLLDEAARDDERASGEMLLPETLHSHVAVKGGGVSAMPSMHLASVSIYICAARRTRLLVPAVLLWITIFVSSGYFGYHYWVDGIVAAGVAAICWSASEALYAPNRRLGFAFGRRFEVPSAC